MNLQREEGEGEQEEDSGQHSHGGQARHVMPSGLPASQTEALRQQKIHFSIRSNNKNITLIQNVQSGLTYSLPCCIQALHQKAVNR